MRTRILIALLVVLVLSAAPVLAQQTQKRSEVELMPVGPPPKEPAPRLWGLYDLHIGMELGGQFESDRGNHEVYRSHLNYTDGFRVFNFNVSALGQPGAFFTKFYFQGAGWGGDPQNWARFGLSKDKWFDFQGQYRRNDYFWVFPGFARDRHRNDQQRRLQDYNLTIFPQRKLRFRVGYSRNSSSGPTVTSSDVDGTRDLFFFLEPLRQTYDEYRVGAEWSLQRWNFFFEQGYRFFRNDREVFLPPETNALVPSQGDLGPPNPAFLTADARDYPIRGRIPFTRFTLSGRPHSSLEVVGSIVYSRPKTNYTRFEFVSGRSFNPPVLFTNTFNSIGRALRPLTSVDWGVTWRPVPKFTLSNTFRFQGYNIAGSDLTDFFSTCSALTNPSACVPGLHEEDLGRLFDVDTVNNRFEGRYDFTPRVGVRAGFSYTHLSFREEEFEDGLLAEVQASKVTNRVFLAGFLFRPRPSFNLFFDLERGNHTGVFTRLSAANIDRIRLRGRWEPIKGVKLAASWFLFDNSNFHVPTMLDPNGRHSARNHGLTLDLQLTRFDRGYLNVGYSRNDVTTFTNVMFFAGGFPATPRAGISLYIANENYAYVDFGGRIAGNLYGDAGYRVVFTTGTYPASDPVGNCVPWFGSCNNTVVLVPMGTHWGGLNYHQPHLGLQYAFNDKVTWKAGWRWYGYNVKAGSLSDYKAHIVTTSLVLKF